MSLKTIRDSFHVQFLQIRNVHRLIRSDNFAIAFSNAVKSEKEKVTKAIVRFDKDSINKFIKNQLQTLTPFHQMNVRQLREIGRNIRLPVYWEKDKITLIREIEHVVARLKAGCE